MARLPRAGWRQGSASAQSVRFLFIDGDETLRERRLRRPRTERGAIEPISPELVLVDPELAARVRALEPVPLWVVPPKPVPLSVVEQTVPRPRKRRAYFAIAWAAAVLTPVAALANVRTSHHSEVTTAGEPFALDRVVERLLPAAVPGAVAAQPQLTAVLDPATGLVRTRTAITCRVRYVGAYWCTLRAPHGSRVTVPVRRTAAGVAVMSG
jgi:hypothetical protein